VQLAFLAALMSVPSRGGESSGRSVTAAWAGAQSPAQISGKRSLGKLHEANQWCCWALLTALGYGRSERLDSQFLSPLHSSPDEAAHLKTV